MSIVNLYGPPVSVDEKHHVDYGRRSGPLYFADREENMAFSQILTSLGYHHKWHRERIKNDIKHVDEIQSAGYAPPSAFKTYDPTNDIRPTGAQYHHTFLLNQGPWSDEIKDAIVVDQRRRDKQRHADVPEGKAVQPVTTQNWEISEAPPKILLPHRDLEDYLGVHRVEDNAVHRYVPKDNPTQAPIVERVELLHPHMHPQIMMPADEKRMHMDHARKRVANMYGYQPPRNRATNAQKGNLDMSFLDALPWPEPDITAAAWQMSEVVGT